MIKPKAVRNVWLKLIDDEALSEVEFMALAAWAYREMPSNRRGGVAFKMFHAVLTAPDIVAEATVEKILSSPTSH